MTNSPKELTQETKHTPTPIEAISKLKEHALSGDMAFINEMLVPIERVCNAHDELVALASNFEITEKEDGVWFILNGNGTSGKAAFNLGNGKLALGVARFLEEDRKRALAKACEATNA